MFINKPQKYLLMSADNSDIMVLLSEIQLEKNFPTTKPTTPETPAIKTINGYSVLEQIGGGGMGRTYKAWNSAGEEVCLKEFRFGTRSDEEDAFKLEELFQREAKVLERLKHKDIPEFKGYFTAEENGEVRQYIAMEYVRGQNLQEIVKGGYRFTEKEAVEVAEQVLGQLEYLHSFAVPIVHRDVKPSNLIKKENGHYALVDFGSVHDKVAKSLGGSTVIGTYGYAPMEMFYGRPVPKTDVYSLAATLVYLLTGEEPADFMNSEHRLDLEKLNLTPDFKKLLYDTTELNLEKRLSVPEVQKRLKERSNLEGKVENTLTSKFAESRRYIESCIQCGTLGGFFSLVDLWLAIAPELVRRITERDYNDCLTIVCALVASLVMNPVFGSLAGDYYAKRKIRKKKERQALKLREKIVDAEFKEVEEQPQIVGFKPVRIEEQTPLVSEPIINIEAEEELAELDLEESNASILKVFTPQ